METMDGAAPNYRMLLGAWRLVQNERRMEDTGEVIIRPDPRGFAVFEPMGRAMFVMTGSGRSPPADDAQAAALFNGMTAYTGRFRVEGDRIIIAVDVAWHPAWEGTEQVRFFAVEGDRLTLRTGLQEHPLAPGRKFVGMFTWIREG
ncbi:lipocalin-like domain-containing protein [Sabulicella rubraurantiaca]|uniref:lipocalin-like domain-containing protein n=1 Tax=Sabulicella rubraurantiaca TaxID=2811429 RepID=UPI001A976AB1|nr:lipocalin-like domain-containing protein [Sabulicella rubraurantiaca]